jgi:hypothetical protein
MIRVLTGRRDTPEWVTDYLREIGGMNLYGSPNFIMFWGETGRMKRFGHVVMQAESELWPCWHRAMWRAADDADPMYNLGPSQLWDHSVLGEYPHRGAYHIIQTLCHRYRESGVMITEPQPATLNRNIVNFVASVAKLHIRDSLAKRERVLKEAKEKENREIERVIADRLADATPQWKDAISFSGQVNKHSVVQQRIEQIERNHARVLRFRKQVPKGISVAR